MLVWQALYQHSPLIRTSYLCFGRTKLSFLNDHGTSVGIWCIIYFLYPLVRKILLTAIFSESHRSSGERFIGHVVALALMNSKTSIYLKQKSAF